MGEGGGTGCVYEPLSSAVESVPEESVGSMAARLSSDTLVQADDRLRCRHQCIGSWDIWGSTLGRRNGQEGPDQPQSVRALPSWSPYLLFSWTPALLATSSSIPDVCFFFLLQPPPPDLILCPTIPCYLLPLSLLSSVLPLPSPLLALSAPHTSCSAHGGTCALLEAALGARPAPAGVQ